MKHILRFFAVFLLFICICVLSLQAQVKEYVVSSSTSPSDIERLARMMEGNYSSEAQSKKDTSYLDIRLHIKRIWQNRNDGIWFYVEQALARLQNKPYRQRIYRLTKIDDSTFESTVYTINDPLRFAGEWKKPNLLYSLLPDSLVLRKGCSVFLHNDGVGYTGSTQEKTCPSELQGAAYATSSVTLTATTLLSWDRGFDAQNTQVWGAVKGAYQFVKQK